MVYVCRVVCSFGGGVHWWHMCRIQDLPDLPEVGSGPLVARSPPFVRFTALLFVVSLANMALFRILRGF